METYLDRQGPGVGFEEMGKERQKTKTKQSTLSFNAMGRYNGRVISPLAETQEREQTVLSCTGNLQVGGDT